MVCAYTPTPHYHEPFRSIVSTWEDEAHLCPGEEAGPQGPFDRYAFCSRTPLWWRTVIWPAASVSARVTSMYPVEWRMRSPKGHCHGNRVTPPPMTVRPSPSTTLSSQGNLPGPLPSQLTASVSVRTLVRVTKGA